MFCEFREHDHACVAHTHADRLVGMLRTVMCQANAAMSAPLCKR